MADISKLKLAGTTYNIKDATARAGLEEKQDKLTAGNNITLTDNTISALKYYKQSEVIGVAGTSTTQLSSTYNVTDATVTSYYDGMVVSFVLPVAGVSTYGSVFQFNSLGYKPIVYGTNSIVGTRYPVGGQITMVYNSVQTASAYLTKNVKTTITGCWQVCDYDTSTTDARKVFDYYLRPYAAETIYRYKLCALDKDNRLHPITVTNQESATQVAKVPTSAALKPSDLWFYTSTTTGATNKVIAASTLATTYYGDNMCQYNFNTSCAAYKMIYLRGTYDSATGLFTLYNDGSSPCTSYYTTVPNNTANITLSDYFTSGYYYWLVGSTYSNADYLSVFGYNPLYYFDGTNLIPYGQQAINKLKEDLDNLVDLSSYTQGSVVPASLVAFLESHKAHVRVKYNHRIYVPNANFSTESLADAITFVSIDSSGADALQVITITKAVSATDYLLHYGSADVATYDTNGLLTLKLDPTDKKITLRDTVNSRTIDLIKNSSQTSNIQLTLPSESGTIALVGQGGDITREKIVELLGYNPYSDQNPAGYISGITSAMVTTALGYTPYNASNPAGYISGITGQMVTTALGYTPYNASNPAGYITGINAQMVETALGYVPYDSSNPSGYISDYTVTQQDVTSALGYTPYNASNPAGYITGITSAMVSTALGYIPYDSANPNGYITGISSSDVTTALGYTPYNATNPNNYVNVNVNNLNNYYTKTAVDGMVANRFQAKIVQALPTSGISTSTIYMVLQTGHTDVYDEYMYIENTWVKIGTTSIDMSDYAKTTELHNVALTGAYSSLVGKPTIPTNTSDLTNDSGFITNSVDNLTNYPKTTDLSAVAYSGSYNDLSNRPTIPTSVSQLTNDSGYVTPANLALTNISTFINNVPYATLNDVRGLEDIDVEEIKKAIAAMEHIGTVTWVAGGTGLTGGGNTNVVIDHANAVAENTAWPSGPVNPENGGWFNVRDVKYDTTGHVTAYQDRKITLPLIPEYDDTEVRGLISTETTARQATDARVTSLENFNRDTFTSFVFCVFGIEPYIDPNTMQIVPDRYYQRSDIDTGIYMDNNKVDIHLKAWLKYHYGIESLDYLKNITCYVYAQGDHGVYVNHMVTFWSQQTNPSITSYPHLQQVGSFIDDGYGSVRRFTATEIGAILSSSDDGYVQADPLGTGKGMVSGWNTLTGRVTSLEETIGDINDALDAINRTVI